MWLAQWIVIWGYNTVDCSYLIVFGFLCQLVPPPLSSWNCNDTVTRKTGSSCHLFLYLYRLLMTDLSHVSLRQIVCNLYTRALCRTKLLPVTHVLVDTWMWTVKPVYKLKNVSDDLKWTTNTHVTLLHSLLWHNWQYLLVLEDLFIFY